MIDAAPPSFHRRWPNALGRRTLIMGIVNLTPDSFSDGGRIRNEDEAVSEALRQVEDGADIIDIGAESTRPGAMRIEADEELARLLPGLRAISDKVSVPISVDTYKASTAAAALASGASIINDVWGLTGDRDMARVVAEHDAGLCIMHNRTDVDPGCDIIADVKDFFSRSLDIATRAGIAPEHIVLDPGIGFGKTFDQNLICLQRLAELRTFGLPLLVGCSRKGFIGAISGRTRADERLNGTLAAHVASVLNGAAIVRVHDIAAHREARAVTDAIMRGSVSMQEEGQ